MLTVLFWNTGRRPILHLVAALAEERSPDVIILAESRDSEVAAVEALNSRGARLYSQTTNFSSRLQFFVGFSPEAFTPMADDLGVSSRRVQPPVGQDIVLVAVHLGSKRHLSNDDQAQLAPRLRERVDDSERHAGHSRTVVIGDFNMNPFEVGMVSSEGAHAIMSRSIASRGRRKVQHRHRMFFYNPMWSLLGDMTPGPPGTYYYRSSRPYSLHWHMFDQILFRPELARLFQPGDVSVIQHVGGQSLLTSVGTPKPSVSDHLPIVAIIRTQETSHAI